MVVSFVLLFALALTVYGSAVHTDVPRWGAEAERQWDDEVQAALTRFAREAGGSVGSNVAVKGIVPQPPIAQALDWPIIGRTEPVPATGTVAFEAPCDAGSGETSWRAVHLVGVETVLDVSDDTPQGCLTFRAQPSYSDSFGYRLEFGGLLRVQSDRAVVLVGPPLELDPEFEDVLGNEVHRVALSMPSLQGRSDSRSVAETSPSIDLTPGAVSTEVIHAANARTVQWTFESAYPTAWKAWFEERFESAEFDSADYNVCVFGSGCTSSPQNNVLLSADMPGPDQVRVTIRGPDATATDRDVLLTLNYGTYQVSMR